jgi:hypothetical protein
MATLLGLLLFYIIGFAIIELFLRWFKKRQQLTQERILMIKTKAVEKYINSCGDDHAKSIYAKLPARQKCSPYYLRHAALNSNNVALATAYAIANGMIWEYHKATISNNDYETRIAEFHQFLAARPSLSLALDESDKRIHLGMSDMNRWETPLNHDSSSYDSSDFGGSSGSGGSND